MNITSTPPTSATQMARWTHDDDRYSAMVSRTEHQQDGKRGWAYELRHPSTLNPEHVVMSHSFAAPGECIYTWDTDPLDVLHTLASFVDAWREAQSYPDSDNRDLFPERVEAFLQVAEDFYMHTYRGDTDG
jgi:hypothetical protein